MLAEIGHSLDADFVFRNEDIFAALRVGLAEEVLAAHALLSHTGATAFNTATTGLVELTGALFVDQVKGEVVSLSDAVGAVADLLGFVQHCAMPGAERAGAVLAQANGGFIARVEDAGFEGASLTRCRIHDCILRSF